MKLNIHNYNYEVAIFSQVSKNTSDNTQTSVFTDLLPNIELFSMIYLGTSNYSRGAQGHFSFPVGATRKVYIKNDSNNMGKSYHVALGYRRIGTNS